MSNKLSSLLMLGLLLAGMLIVAIPTVYALEPTMYLEASVTTGLDPGNPDLNHFDLFVLFRDFTDMYGWQVGLTWDKTVLRAESVVYGKTAYPESVFAVLAPTRTTNTFDGVIDNDNGQIYPPYAESLTGTGGVTGDPGTGYYLMKVTFTVIGFAPEPDGTTIDFIVADPYGPVSAWTQYPDVATLLTPNFESITVYTIAPPTPYSPTADFTWLPVFPKEGDTVTFDASASTPGFDGSAICPITEYRWDFDGDLVWDKIVTDPITTWSYTTAGDYDVTLEVYAPGAYPPEVPDTDSITKTITVLPPPMGAAIDLYCQKTPWDGTGPDVESDAFAPQELVILYAKVTYNDDPVANKQVGFQVNASDGTAILYRVAETDESGIATVEFRIPSDPVFGEWLAYAIVDVAGTTVADTMPFDVGWIIEILSVTPVESTYSKGETASFTLSIKNLGKTTKTPTITVVVYDECAVPIAVALVSEWSIEGEATAEFSCKLDIPMWAFVGTATVYANAFTDLPSNDGVPYCPEAQANFLISKP